jgi:lipopolysaccharide/colanic/teichoic acid biosynthesis glycosyltransferase
VTSIQLEYLRDRGLGGGMGDATMDRDPSGVERSIRLLNVAAAAIIITLTAPVMFLVAVVVKLTSKGPILYTQTRIGIDRRNGSRGPDDHRRLFDCGGRPFRIYKFRTMHVANDDWRSGRWATPQDPRVTPVGRWLRKLRLDELPQLFNVLTGDMNLVGPRPEQPKIFVELREQIDTYELRQRVAPGITGLAQINQAYDQSIDDVRRKVAYDLEYIAQRSLMQDLKIMLRTVPAVLLKRGAW